MLMDPLLLGITQPHDLSFLAKATLFQSPLLGRFLAAHGVLPIYRRSDNPDDMGQNVVTFAACFELLEKGGAIALFPEGKSHARQAVLPLRTGCARIVLEVEDKNRYRLGVKIVPVGIYFSERHIFRSDALVVYGEILEPSDYFDRYRVDPPAAVRDLTAELERRLQRLTLHVPRAEDEALLSALGQIFSATSDMTRRLEVDRILVKAVEHFRLNDPARYRELRRQVLRYNRLLSALALEHSQVVRRYRAKTVLRYLGPRLVLGSLGFPFFLWGAVNNFLPYKTPGWMSRLVARGVTEVATVKFLSGMVSFPFFYALQTGLVGYWAGVKPAFIYLLLLPLTGLFALRYQEAMDGLFDEIRVFFFHLLKPDRVGRLQEWRDAITNELERCRKEYLQTAGEEVAD
jgi:1-acyl-sn-glycerol-3-phosphate acyltransferase